MTKRIALILFCPFIIFLIGCEDPSTVGETILPDNDQLPVDSILFNDMKLSTVADDTLYTGFRDIVLIGQRNNPTFGTSIAKFYTNFHYGNSFNQVDNAVLDSAKVFLQVNQYEGDTTSYQTISIYELTEDINDFNLLIGDEFETGNRIGGFDNFRLSPTQANADKYISTTIEQEFATRLFNALNSGNITDNNQFIEQFKGLAFVPETNDQANILFNTSIGVTSTSGLQLYYHDENDSTFVERLVFAPQIDDETYSSYNHNYLATDYELGNTDIATQINTINGAFNTAYLQGGNGVLAKLNFENALSSLSDEENHINNAQLIIKPNFTVTDTTYLPNQLTLYESFALNDTGEKTGSMIDIIGNGLDTVNPNRTYDLLSTASLSLINNEFVYTFYLPNYIQEILKDENDVQPYLYVGVPNRSQTFKGISFDTDNVELKIYYSKKD